MDNNTFGTRLRTARKKANMTQKDLAVAVGSKHNSVSNWENDQNMPDPDTIVKICEVLNVSASYMLPSKSAVANKAESAAEPSNAGISEAAMRIATLFDSLDDAGKELINVVIDLQVKRMEGEQMRVRRIPVIKGTEDSIVFAKYMSKREAQELAKEREELAKEREELAQRT